MHIRTEYLAFSTPAARIDLSAIMKGCEQTGPGQISAIPAIPVDWRDGCPRTTYIMAHQSLTRRQDMKYPRIYTGHMAPSGGNERRIALG
jgi:hypothetical protein